MRKRREQEHNDPWDRDYYGTGSTQPPKSHGGIIALLLVLVIVLGSTTTYLGLMNIQLFHQLEQEKENIQVLQPQEPTADPQDTQETAAQNGAGMLNVLCATVSEFDIRYYGLPHGCLITGVVEGGGADRAGIRTGDVIVRFEGRAVKNVEQLAKGLSQCTVGQTVHVEVYRPQTEKILALEVTLDERGENG